MSNNSVNTKKILIIFPSLQPKNDEGSKHRLNSFIDIYSRNQFNVFVLAFIKGSILVNDKYLNKRAKWLFVPQVFPIARSKILSKCYNLYVSMIIWGLTRIRKFDVVQMEMFGVDKKFVNTPQYIIDIHGDSYHEFVETYRGTKDHWYAYDQIKMQRLCVNCADILITVSENLSKQLELNTQSIIKNNVIIPCAIDLDKFNINHNNKKRINISDKIILGYCGGLQSWQNIDKILNIIIRLNKLDPRVYFMLYTNSDTNNIKCLLDELGQENYSIKALKSHEVPEHLRLLDAGFLYRDNLTLNKVSSPTKILEYLASGVALICTEYSGDYSTVSKIGENCYVVSDDISKIDYEDLLKWIINYKQSCRDNSYLDAYTFANKAKALLAQL